MGYTHYWYRAEKIGKVLWGHVVSDVRKILAALPKEIEMAGMQGQRDTAPRLTADSIEFNGVDENAHESFFVERIFTDRHTREGSCFAFCKTAEKPYDLAVTAALVVLKHYLRDEITISSDGEEADWNKAKILCQEALGYGREMTFNADGKLEPLIPAKMAKEEGSVPV